MSAFDPSFEQLPQTLPIFPLTGVLLLPRGELPLNIFEPRYLAMTDDALRAERLIGMVQPRHPGPDRRAAPEVFEIGCAGKITAFQETDDGRYLLSLKGLARFRVVEEMPTVRGYRRVVADWGPFAGDLVAPRDELVNHDGDPVRSHFVDLLRDYLKMHSIRANWEAIESTPTEKLVSTIAMICPFEPNEKQAILEAGGLDERLKLMTTMLEMSVAGSAEAGDGARH